MKTVYVIETASNRYAPYVAQSGLVYDCPADALDALDERKERYPFARVAMRNVAVPA